MVTGKLDLETHSLEDPSNAHMGLLLYFFSFLWETAYFEFVPEFLGAVCPRFPRAFISYGRENLESIRLKRQKIFPDILPCAIGRRNSCFRISDYVKDKRLK